MKEKDEISGTIFLDAARARRNAFTEVIFAQGKSVEQMVAIIRKMKEKGENVFGTRCDAAAAEKLEEQFPDLRYDFLSKTFRLIQKSVPPIAGTLAILAAGTADAPVAEEARHTAQFYGAEAKRFYDVGVAGLHRLLEKIPEIRECDAAIVVAGMEGALPSVLGGLVKIPIIACPTSVGYGAHLAGFTPLMAMLSSCSEGICVVNIDNGFGAACAALRILRKKIENGGCQGGEI